LRKRNKDSTIAYAAFIRSPKVNLNPIKEACLRHFDNFIILHQNRYWHGHKSQFN
jgi:hypothetical protein